MWQGPKPHHHSDLLTINGHVIISAFDQLEAPELACGCKPFDVTLYDSLWSTIHLWVGSWSHNLLAYTQAPDVQSIIIGQGSNAWSMILIV